MPKHYFNLPAVATACAIFFLLFFFVFHGVFTAFVGESLSSTYLFVLLLLLLLLLLVVVVLRGGRVVDRVDRLLAVDGKPRVGVAPLVIERRVHIGLYKIELA